MRYLCLSYYRKANGQMDESMSVTSRLRDRDLQTAAVILDFKELRVIKASMNDVTLPKNFERITSYYRQFYKNTIDRLFRENGYEVEDTPETASAEPQDQSQ